jgi:hypothetical protein
MLDGERDADNRNRKYQREDDMGRRDPNPANEQPKDVEYRRQTARTTGDRSRLAPKRQQHERDRVKTRTMKLRRKQYRAAQAA